MIIQNIMLRSISAGSVCTLRLMILATVSTYVLILDYCYAGHRKKPSPQTPWVWVWWVLLLNIILSLARETTHS